MTLSRQLILLIAALLVVLFVGTLTITVNNTRTFLASQLASHAQDAATSLGLSATAHVASGDQAMVTAMVNAMFHRGDYLSIRFEDLDRSAWLERATELHLDDVPDWFRNTFPLEAPRRSATLMSGWQQVGRVYVTSHPRHAYQQLWHTAVHTARLFAIGAVLALLAGILGLRLLLRPLRDVEAQATAICGREFPVVERHPRTLELRRVVEAMNRLSTRVSRMLGDAESLADDLRRQAYQDAVTGLANRRQFMDVLAHRVGDSEQFGSGGLLLLQLREFKAYNQSAGYVAGDRLLAETGSAIDAVLRREPRATLARLSGADFAVLIENVDEARLRDIAAQIDAAVATLYGRLELPSADVAHVGGVVFCGQDAETLLADADLALREAQRAGANEVVIRRCADRPATVRSGSEWRTLIERALAARAFRLLRQPVVASAGGSVLHDEVFVRMRDPDGNGQEINAAELMPMAENAGLAARVDRAVIDSVLGGLDAGDYAARVAVNLSPSSLPDGDFLDWLATALARRRGAAGRLIFELPEYGATAQADALSVWLSRLQPLGVEFSLDHFGKGFTAFAYLRRIKVDYLKIDGSFVRALASREDNRFFLRTLADIAHSLDMRVIAEAVETESDWQALQRLGIDGGRGYWLGRPE